LKGLVIVAIMTISRPNSAEKSNYFGWAQTPLGELMALPQIPTGGVEGA